MLAVFITDIQDNVQYQNSPILVIIASQSHGLLY